MDQRQRPEQSTPGTRFPDAVVVALHEAQLTATCLPVQLDDGEWQAAVFMVVSPDAPAFRQGQLAGGPFTVALDADLHEHPHASVIELGLEVRTRPESLNTTLLLLTGHSSGHFEALKLLHTQHELPLFIGDPYCQLVWQQRVPLSEQARNGLKNLLDEAVRRDAMIRMTGHYDPDSAFGDIIKTLQLQ